MGVETAPKIACSDTTVALECARSFFGAMSQPSQAEVDAELLECARYGEEDELTAMLELGAPPHAALMRVLMRARFKG